MRLSPSRTRQIQALADRQRCKNCMVPRPLCCLIDIHNLPSLCKSAHLAVFPFHPYRHASCVEQCRGEGLSQNLGQGYRNASLDLPGLYETPHHGNLGQRDSTGLLRAVRSAAPAKRTDSLTEETERNWADDRGETGGAKKGTFRWVNKMEWRGGMNVVLDPIPPMRYGLQRKRPSFDGSWLVSPTVGNFPIT
jgi:hypothetical protein